MLPHFFASNISSAPFLRSSILVPAWLYLAPLVAPLALPTLRNRLAPLAARELVAIPAVKYSDSTAPATNDNPWEKSFVQKLDVPIDCQKL